jgi:hypothetical protein
MNKKVKSSATEGSGMMHSKKAVTYLLPILGERIGERRVASIRLATRKYPIINP